MRELLDAITLVNQTTGLRDDHPEQQVPDKAIAAILNRASKATGRGNGWTRSRVRWLRNHRSIPSYREGERAERGETTLEEAAAVLKVSEATV
jgi:hypothetical protein